MTGTYIWLQYQKHQLKGRVKNQLLSQIDKKELVSLTFTSKQTASVLRWEHDKEFEYKGQMYDVVEVKSNGDTTTYICWWDHHETALNLQLSELVDMGIGQDPQNHKKQEQLKDFFKSIYFISSQFAFLSELESISLTYCFLYPNKTAEYSTILSPPPETVS